MEIIQQIAQKINARGGRMFFVGGYVRDRLLQRTHEDIDFEIFHLSLEELIIVLEQFGTLDLIGKNFGIIKIANYPQFDFSLPRKEKQTGSTHTAFSITIKPDLSYAEAARRRDFTCNALMQDVLTDEVLDFFSGLGDIASQVLRHIDETTFIEDPLRGLRAAQLATRFNFTIDPATQTIIKHFSYAFLSPERIQAELQKGLLSSHSSRFLPLLFDLNISQQILPALADLKAKNSQEYDNVLEILDQVDKFHYELALAQVLKLTALVFYLDEKQTSGTLLTFTNNKKHIHDILSLQNNIKTTAYITNPTAARQLKNKLQDTTSYWLFLSHIVLVDNTILPQAYTNLEDYQKFFLTSIKNNPASLPLIQGRDLIKLGFSPDKDFAQMLQFARKLEEEGFDKQSIETELLKTYTTLKN